MAISRSNFISQLRTIIGATTAITDIVSTRYYYGRLQQLETGAALVFDIVSITPHDTKDNAGPYDVVRVQFDSISSDADEVESLNDAIRTKFDYYTNEAGSIKYHKTFFLNSQGLSQDFDTKIYWVSSDYYFHIK